MFWISKSFHFVLCLIVWLTQWPGRIASNEWRINVWFALGEKFSAAYRGSANFYALSFASTILTISLKIIKNKHLQIKVKIIMKNKFTVSALSRSFIYLWIVWPCHWAFFGWLRAIRSGPQLTVENDLTKHGRWTIYSFLFLLCESALAVIWPPSLAKSF